MRLRTPRADAPAGWRRCRPTSRRRGAAAAAAVAVLTGVLVPASAAAEPLAVSAARPALPVTGSYFGAAVEPERDDAAPTCRSADEVQAVQNFERCVGASIKLVRRFALWDTNQKGEVWPTAADRRLAATGHRLHISWRPKTFGGQSRKWPDVASGKYDREIDAKAAALKSFGAPVHLTFSHEPETVSVIGSPADFTRAWQRIVTRFRAKGATNVSFVLVLTGWSFDPRSGRNPDNYYPGAGYVDAIGVDGYNYFGCITGGGAEWRSFGSIFAKPYEWVLRKGKPMFIPEWGSVEDPASPGRKAAWMRDATAWMKSHRNVKAATYFHKDNVGEVPGRGCRWTVDTSSTSLAAFSRAVKDPYFRPA